MNILQKAWSEFIHLGHMLRNVFVNTGENEMQVLKDGQITEVPDIPGTQGAAEAASAASAEAAPQGSGDPGLPATGLETGAVQAASGGPAAEAAPLPLTASSQTQEQAQAQAIKAAVTASTEVVRRMMEPIIVPPPVSDQNTAAKATIDNVFALVDQYDSVDEEIASYEESIANLQMKVEMAKKRKETLPTKASSLLMRLLRDIHQYADIFGVSLDEIEEEEHPSPGPAGGPAGGGASKA